MRKSILVLSGVFAVSTLMLASGCSNKPSCKLLYKRYKKCDKMPLTEDHFISYCKKAKKQSRMQETIQCSKESDCSKFKACLKRARKKARQARMKKRWSEAMERANKGNYSRAMTFCRIWRKSLEGDMKKTCDALPAKATDALMKEITAKRDKGDVSYKSVRCWSLRQYAKDVSPAKAKEADLLCKEVQIARDLKKAKEEVKKQLTKARPYLPYYCSIKMVDKVAKLGSPYAKKTHQLLVDLCYKQLGKVILQKKVPKQTVICLVATTYQAVKKFGVKDPEIDKLMEQAAPKCDSAKKAKK